MPEVSSITAWIWGISIFLKLALVTVLLVSGRYRHWPSLFCYSIFQACKSLTLLYFFISQDAASYFYCYWRGGLVAELIAIWALCDLIKSIVFPSRSARAWATILAINICGASVLLCAWLALNSRGPYGIEISEWNMALEKGVSLAWCASLLAIIMRAELIGARWRKESLLIMWGFCLSEGSGTLCYWVFSWVPFSAREIYSTTKDVLGLIAIVLWMIPQHFTLPRALRSRLKLAIEVNERSIQGMFGMKRGSK